MPLAFEAPASFSRKSIRPHCLCDVGHDLVGAGEQGDVGLVGERLAAKRLDLARGARHLGLEQVDQGDVVAARRQFERAAAADAARAAGDDGGLAHAACSLA